MRKFIGIFVGVFVLGFCSNALAIDLAGKFSFNMGIGVGARIGNMGDYYKFGYNGNLGLGYFFADQFSLEAQFAYYAFGVKNAIPGVSANINYLYFGGSLKYIIPNSLYGFSPYVRIGAGLYKPGFTVSSGGGTASIGFDKQFGINGGLGSILQISDNVLLNGEISYHSVSTKNAESDGWVMVFDSQFVAVCLGLVYTFGGG